MVVGSPTFRLVSEKCLATICLVASMSGLLFLGAPMAEAAGSDGIELSVTVEGHALDSGELVLEAAERARVVVSVQNLTQSALEVDSVRLSGTVLGLTFFDYDTRVQASVPARGSANWTVDLDTRDLDGRATGSMPVEVELRGKDLATVAAVSGTADVRGSLISIYGLFGLGLIILMGLLWAVALLPLGRHAVAVKPWQRGLRFVPAGCGVGLFLVFSLSVLRVMAPSTPTDFGITVGSAAVCFGIGYLLTPDDVGGSRR